MLAQQRDARSRSKTWHHHPKEKRRHRARLPAQPNMRRATSANLSSTTETTTSSHRQHRARSSEAYSDDARFQGPDADGGHGKRRRRDNNDRISMAAAGVAASPLPASMGAAETLPSIDFGFDDLRDRMNKFTARFDAFIEQGRKRLLEERNQFRMNVAELQGKLSPLGSWGVDD